MIPGPYSAFLTPQNVVIQQNRPPAPGKTHAILLLKPKNHQMYYRDTFAYEGVLTAS